MLPLASDASRFWLLTLARSGEPSFLPPETGRGVLALEDFRRRYLHRLHAIGHPHEAEDESQQWPELHAAIRHACRAFQQAGTMPDFAEIALVQHPHAMV